MEQLSPVTTTILLVNADGVFSLGPSTVLTHIEVIFN